jgi:hypothetical protein
MKISNLILILFAILCVNKANATITVVVLKGKASIEDQQVKTAVLRTQKAIIPNAAKLVINSNSSIIVYNNKAKLELVNQNEVTYTYSQLNTMLGKVKPGSLTAGFINYLDKMYSNIENSNDSYGGTVGAVSRGTKAENLSYYPPDETIILSDTFELTIGDSNTILLSNITITDDSTQSIDTVNAVRNSVKIKNLKPGHYTWQYKINSDKGPRKFKNTFIVPDEKLKTEKIKIVNDFINNLNKFKDTLSKETKAILLKDFLALNKLHIN